MYFIIIASFCHESGILSLEIGSESGKCITAWCQFPLKVANLGVTVPCCRPVVYEASL